MEIMDHKVTVDGAGTVTVSFIGEGEELISVRINNSGRPPMSEAAAIDKAKALMAQVSTFGLTKAECDEAAASNRRDESRGEAPRALL